MGSFKACALLLILGIGNEAYSQPLVEPQVIQLKVTYYECLNPVEQPPCVCSREDQKSESCPNCQAWAEKTVSSEFNIAFGKRGTLYSSGSAPANYFVQDIAKTIYGTDRPSAPPPTTSLLYKDPARYGWLELDKKSDVTGSVAVWSGGAGLVIDSKSGNTRVLYPSQKLRTLNVEDLHDLTPPGQVKYIIPKNFVIEKAAESGQPSSPPGPF
jgi:hypothetical protein